jgi:hypothetical protein
MDIEQYHHELAEEKARYDAINQSWEDSDLPVYVLQTPDWQEGWDVMLAWLAPHWMIRMGGQAAWDRCGKYMPGSKTTWQNEIHIFSHMFHTGPQGHGPSHLAVEEEGAQAILVWWNDRSAKS